MIAIAAHVPLTIARDAIIVAAIATPVIEWTRRLRTRLGRRRDLPILVLGKFLGRIPLEPLKITRLCFLELGGWPEVAAGLLRGPGTVREGTVKDVERLSPAAMRPTFNKRFAHGDRCVVAVIDDRIVGYEWFSARPILWNSRPAYDLGIPEGFVYAYDAVIDPEYRNCGFWPRFKAHLTTRMKDENKIGVITYVTFGNWPSLKAHLRLGFQPTKTLLAIRVLGLTLLVNESPKPVQALKDAFCGHPARHAPPARLGLGQSA